MRDRLLLNTTSGLKVDVKSFIIGNKGNLRLFFGDWLELKLSYHYDKASKAHVLSVSDSSKEDLLLSALMNQLDPELSLDTLDVEIPVQGLAVEAKELEDPGEGVNVSYELSFSPLQKEVSLHPLFQIARVQLKLLLHLKTDDSLLIEGAFISGELNMGESTRITLQGNTFQQEYHGELEVAKGISQEDLFKLLDAPFPKDIQLAAINNARLDLYQKDHTWQARLGVSASIALQEIFEIALEEITLRSVREELTLGAKGWVEIGGVKVACSVQYDFAAETWTIIVNYEDQGKPFSFLSLTEWLHEDLNFGFGHLQLTKLDLEIILAGKAKAFTIDFKTAANWNPTGLFTIHDPGFYIKRTVDFPIPACRVSGWIEFHDVNVNVDLDWLEIGWGVKLHGLAGISLNDFWSVPDLTGVTFPDISSVLPWIALPDIQLKSFSIEWKPGFPDFDVQFALPPFEIDLPRLAGFDLAFKDLAFQFKPDFRLFSGIISLEGWEFDITGKFELDHWDLTVDLDFSSGLSLPDYWVDFKAKFPDLTGLHLHFKEFSLEGFAELNIQFQGFDPKLKDLFAYFPDFQLPEIDLDFNLSELKLLLPDYSPDLSFPDLRKRFDSLNFNWIGTTWLQIDEIRLLGQFFSFETDWKVQLQVPELLKLSEFPVLSDYFDFKTPDFGNVLPFTSVPDLSFQDLKLNFDAGFTDVDFNFTIPDFDLDLTGIDFNFKEIKINWLPDFRELEGILSWNSWDFEITGKFELENWDLKVDLDFDSGLNLPQFLVDLKVKFPELNGLNIQFKEFKLDGFAELSIDFKEFEPNLKDLFSFLSDFHFPEIDLDFSLSSLKFRLPDYKPDVSLSDLLKRFESLDFDWNGIGGLDLNGIRIMGEFYSIGKDWKVKLRIPEPFRLSEFPVLSDYFGFEAPDFSNLLPFITLPDISVQDLSLDFNADFSDFDIDFSIADFTIDLFDVDGFDFRLKDLDFHFKPDFRKLQGLVFINDWGLNLNGLFELGNWNINLKLALDHELELPDFFHSLKVNFPGLDGLELNFKEFNLDGLANLNIGFNGFDINFNSILTFITGIDISLFDHDFHVQGFNLTFDNYLPGELSRTQRYQGNLELVGADGVLSHELNVLDRVNVKKLQFGFDLLRFDYIQFKLEDLTLKAALEKTSDLFNFKALAGLDLPDPLPIPLLRDVVNSVDELEVSYALKKAVYEVRLYANECHAQYILFGKKSLTFRDIEVILKPTKKTFVGTLRLGSESLVVTGATTSDQWELAGSMDMQGGKRTIGSMLSIPPFPGWLDHIYLRRWSFHHSTQETKIALESGVEVSEKEVDVMISLSSTEEHAKSKKLDLAIYIPLDEGRRFDLSWSDGATDVLFAQYHSPEADRLALRELCAYLSPEFASIAPPIAVEVKQVQLIFIRAEKSAEKKAKWKTLMGMGLNTSFEVTGLPLIGPKLPAGLEVGMKDLEFLAAFDTLQSEELDALHQVLEQNGSVNKLSGLVTTKKEQGLLPKDFYASFDLVMPDALHTIFLPTESHAEEGNAKVSNTEEIPNDGFFWIELNAALGAVHLARMGVKYQGGKLWFAFDTAIQAGGMTLTFINLAMGSTLDQFNPEFDLRGLGLTYRQPPVEITGALIREGNGFDRFSGLGVIKTESINLSAIAGYDHNSGNPSLFAYAYLDQPIGGSPEFFVTGLAAGFGYNRKLRIPTLDEVEDFPLVAVVTGRGKNSNLSSSFNAGGKHLNPNHVGHILRSLSSWIPTRRDHQFLAIGVKFTTYKVVDSFGLVIFNFGRKVDVDLLGVSHVVLPDKFNPLAQMFISWKGKYDVEEGELLVVGKLTDGSYVFSRRCELTGEFAIASWFKGAHQGDFVISVGGYHPKFRVPAHYPKHLERLRFHWPLGGNLEAKGSMYLAITPFALMAGGDFRVTWNWEGCIWAYFNMGVNLLISWKPYYYEADARLSMGGEFRKKVFGITVRIGFDLSATMELWGPDFSGRVGLEIGPFNPTIDFGEEKQEKSRISWNEFRNTFLPEAGQVCGIDITDGLVKSYQIGRETIHEVSPSAFQLNTHSFIPTNIIKTDAEARSQAGTTAFGIAPLGGFDYLDRDKTEHRVKVYYEGQDITTQFTYRTVNKNMSAALWGTSNSKTINDQRTINDLISGLSLKPKLGEGLGQSQVFEIAAYAVVESNQTPGTWSEVDESSTRAEGDDWIEGDRVEEVVMTIFPSDDDFVVDMQGFDPQKTFLINPELAK